MSFSEFIVNNWSYISIAIVVLLEIALLVVKRFKVKLKLSDSTYSQLVDLVKEAEEVIGSGNGEKKLNYVLETYCKKNEIKYFSTEVKAFIEPIIEKILSTPEKKGLKDE